MRELMARHWRVVLWLAGLVIALATGFPLRWVSLWR